MTSILGYPVLEWVFCATVGLLFGIVHALMWRRKALKAEKEYEEQKALVEALSCDECGIIVDGHGDGWHDHTKHGELTVCVDCSDSCEACGWGEPCECEEEE